MFIHLIPLEELKRHSETYWRPGRDTYGPADTWVILSERDSGYSTTVLDVSTADGARRCLAAEDVLALFLRDEAESA